MRKLVCPPWRRPSFTAGVYPGRRGPPVGSAADAAAGRRRGDLAGISPQTVYRLIARDELPVRRIGPRPVYIDTLRLRDLLYPLPR